MDAKCNKCESNKFSIKKRDDKLFCCVICAECGTVVGVLEDIDFKAHHNHVIKNHVFFEKKIIDLEEQIKKMDNREQEMHDMVCYIYSSIEKK